MIDELPRGWSSTTLGEICSKPQYGWTCKATKRGHIKYLRTTDISDGHINWTDVPYCADVPPDIEKYRIKPDDILVSRAGSVGVSFRINDVPYDTVFASYLIRFKPLDGIHPKYVEFFLRSRDYWQAISDFTAGIAIPNVNASKLTTLEVPLSPEIEQQRIVEKLNTLISKVETLQQRLNAIPRILKRFRQSILAAACSGRLSADWREQYSQIEPANTLLNRISKSLPKASNVEDCQPTSSEELLDLPQKWCRCTLSQLFSVQTGATPLKSNKAYFTNGKIPWVKTGEIINGDIWKAEQHITDLAIKETNAKIFPEGTLLIAMYGEGKTRGQVGRLRLQAATNQASAALVNTQLPSATNEYIFYYALSQYHTLRAEAFGGNQPNLSLGIIKKWELNLPPLDEQKEIVTRVKALMLLADAIESRYQKAKSQVDKLSQAVLAKAFRGELVPTEAELAQIEGRSFESAAELLERIKQSSLQVVNPLRTRRTQIPRQKKQNAQSSSAFH